MRVRSWRVISGADVAAYRRAALSVCPLRDGSAETLAFSEDFNAWYGCKTLELEVEREKEDRRIDVAMAIQMSNIRLDRRHRRRRRRDMEAA
jgi:hypothetical protein